MPKKPRTIDLNLLSETIDLMNKATNFQVTSEIIFNFIHNFVNYNLAVIYRLNEKQGNLEMVSCMGADVEKMKKRIPIKIGESAVGQVAKDKKALLINDVLRSKKIRVRQYNDEDPVIRSFMAVPLVVGDKIIGILSVSSSKPYEYDEYHLKMINIITSQGAVLLELNNNITEVESFTNQILENINSGVMVVNHKYEIVTFNKAAEDITGYSLEEVLGKDIRSLPLRERGGDWSIIDSMINRKTLFEESGYFLRKDNLSVRIRLSNSLIYNEEGGLKSCICIFRDTTEIEKLQVQMAREDKLSALGRLTAVIAHEIRNPLLPIRNGSEYLLKKYCKGEDTEELCTLLAIIGKESERLNGFLGQLVNLNKDSLFEVGKCDLIRALEETLSLLSYGIKEKNISLNMDLGPKEIIVSINENNMKQVFLNLLLNAMDGINLNGQGTNRTISIKIYKEKRAIVEITDTGIGIGEEEIDKIFDPFYTTKSHGTGLGLPTIYNILENSLANISIESKEGLGTKVTLYLPLG